MRTICGARAADRRNPSHPCWNVKEHRPSVGAGTGQRPPTSEGSLMPQLMVDFITSLDGYAAAEGWPGFWGLEGPEYLTWLSAAPERDHTTLMGANTYRLMSGFSAGAEDDSMAAVDQMRKVVFSSTLQDPLSWANSRL